MATSTPSHVDLAELTFVPAKDDISGDDDIDLRLELPCGHTAAPSSLFQWCCTCLEQGKTNFYCPALNEEGACCGEELKLDIIRSAAIHMVKGRPRLRDFEEKLAKRADKQCCQYTECPGCRSFIERTDKGSMRVFCTICNYEFCWQCLGPWKRDSKSSVECGNKECKDHSLEILQNCKVIELVDSGITGCPSIRACPTCGLLIEHIDMCKYMTCCRCGAEFCFACLNNAEDCEIMNFMTCDIHVAPKQTAIPVWSGEIQCSRYSSLMD